MEAVVKSRTVETQNLKGFAINDTDVVINRINVGGQFVFAEYSKTYIPGLEHITVFPAENQDEASFLSSSLGVDESLRKMISDIMPKSIKGVIIVNGKKGVMVVITRPPGGVTGKDGVIRTVEYIYKFPQESFQEKLRLSVLPMVYEEDYRDYRDAVHEVTREFTNMFMNELVMINKKRLDNLGRVFDEVADSLSNVGDYLTGVSDTFTKNLEESNIDGLLFNEYPLLKIQTMLESAKAILTSQKL